MKEWLAKDSAKQKADRRAAMALRSCVECGGPLTKVHQRLYCSDTCANRCAARKARAEGRRNYAREYELDADRSWRRYRSRGRPFRPIEVFERDGWVCYLCGGAIDPASKRPDPLSPSIDHVHPMSLGGTDDLGNVRTAHLVCNVRKGAKLLSG
jgi:5-methylcytosine-specific restriction endonuclease McrA